MFGPAVTWVLGVQRALQESLVASIRDMGGTVDATLAAAGFAIALGVVHALTPGHGKAVVFTYFLGRRARPLTGMAMAGKAALVHGASAVFLVLAFGAASSSFGRPAGPAAAFQMASYALIGAIGGFQLWRAFAGAPGAAAQAGSDAGRAALPLAVGLLPCPLTMLIVSYAALHGLVAKAVALAGLVVLGSAMTIDLAGSAGILLRVGIFSRLDPKGRAYQGVLAELEITSSAAIFLLGLPLFAANLIAPS
jgi:ABC-type nickel/cobalt efflux system permease component RcnA